MKTFRMLTRKNFDAMKMNIGRGLFKGMRRSQLLEYMLIVSLFILTFCSVVSFADIVRDVLWYDAEFSVVSDGRNMDEVIMHVNNVTFSECTLYCVQHLKCKSVNYNEQDRLCELCDNEFDVDEAMIDKRWKNYGTPAKQHGGYSEWIDGRCSVTCGYGDKIRYRRCNKPPPRYGGNDCTGPYLQNMCCKMIPCPDVNECLKNDGGCDTNANCTNTIGSRICSCKEGYEGNGSKCNDVNECLKNNGGCGKNANCTNTVGSRICSCKEGYEGNGSKCNDVNECLKNNGGCGKNANCTNTIGSRICSCKEGYEGNGSKKCNDVNECLKNNGGCDTNANCTNTIGSRTCNCMNGYKGDGLTCTDVNECLVNDGDCDTNARCENTIGSRICNCKEGYKGNGSKCTKSCQSMNTRMNGAYITYFNSVRSWQECGRKCLDTPSCVIWTWFTPYNDVNPKWREECHLYSSFTDMKTEINVISGTHGCVA